MANTGTDFFDLFAKEKKGRIYSSDSVSLNDVVSKWKKIDAENNGVITKKDASLYMIRKKQSNPMNGIVRKLTIEFDLEENFNTLIGILIAVAMIKAVMLFFSRYCSQLLSIRLTRDLRMQFFEHIQTLPMSFYNRHNIGSLSSRAVGDAGQIASSLNSCMTNYIQTPCTIVASLLACFYISWELSLIIFIGVPLIVLPVVFLTRRVKRISRQLQRNQESFASVLLDFLSGIHTVKIFAMECFSLRKFRQQNEQMAYLETKSAKYSLLTRPVLHAISTVCMATVVLVGLYMLNMTVPELIVFVAVLHAFYEPVKKFAEENANIQRGVVAAERMYEVLQLKPPCADMDGKVAFNTFSKAIEFDNVSFKYEDRWILKALSFVVEKGTSVAIVGPTGAGKSTIVQLLPRLYTVQEGEIRVDGIPINEYAVKSLRENIAFVPQKPFLFYDTVAENIAFGRNFSMDEIIMASKKAHAHEFIINLPGQYNTLLAETGKNLSGGQQQRLAIARALVKNAPILVMDEATSSLDAISENRIRQAILELHSKITQLLIAHRLSTIEHVDKIIYLQDGMKTAEGSKEELLRKSPHFRLMWENFHRLRDTAKEEQICLNEN